MRLRGLLAGTGIPFGIYVGKTPEREVDVAGVRLPAGSSRADYDARLARARREGSGETVYPAEEVCSREVMRTAGRQPRILLTNVKQLELLLTRQQDIELFSDARLDFLVFDEAPYVHGRARSGDRLPHPASSCVLQRGDQPYGLCRDLRHHRRSGGPADRARVRIAFLRGRGGVGCDGRGRLRGRGLDGGASIHSARAWRRSRPPYSINAFRQWRTRAKPEPTCGRPIERSPGKTWVKATGPEALHEALSRNEIVFRLNEELRSPRALDELPEVIESGAGRPVTEAEVLAWLTFGAASRREGRPLLRPVVHGFVRGIGGAVVTFPEDAEGARLWLAAEDEVPPGDGGDRHAHFPVTTCTTCGQHYYVAFLEDFSFTGRRPGGGRVPVRRDSWWDTLLRRQTAVAGSCCSTA